MTPVSDPDRAHILVLAFNAPARDIRILKQIGSLKRAGYPVSVFARAEADQTCLETSDPGLQEYRIGTGQSHWQVPDLKRVMQSSRGGKLFDGVVGDLLVHSAEQGDRQRDLMRRIFRLGRVVATLHWSARIRRERAKDLRSLRRWFSDAMMRDADGSNRMLTAARYAEQALHFCEHASEWQARLKAIQPPSIIHAHDLATLAAGAVLAERYDAKLIYDAHEYEPENTPRLPADERNAIARFEDCALERASALITVSDNIARLYQRRNPELDISLVHNAPDMRLSSGAAPVLRTRIGLSPDVPLLAFVGLPMLEERGLGVVLEAMVAFPKAHLAVIGPRWAQQDGELMTAVQARGLNARVHLLEPVAPTDVITAIADADISVCLFQDTSLNQRFAMPNKLFESLLAGVPLLVSDLPDMAALVHRMKAGLAVDQTDPDAITDAIRTLLERRTEFVPAGNARAELEQSCSWEGQEQTLLALYERVLAEMDNTVS